MNLMNLWNKLNQRKQRNRHYQRWNFEEIWDIKSSKDDKALSKKLGRTVRAIREKRRER